MVTAAELEIDTSATAEEMAEAMFGPGIEVLDASYTGAETASGTYNDEDGVAEGITPSDTGVILSTGNATDITQSGGDPNRSSGTSTNHKLAGDEDLEEIAGAKTYDAAIFEATFIPAGDTLTMQVTFSSEEYLEYVNSGFNDAVGIWVNGEKAELTVGDGDITINNINDESNANLYLDNPKGEDVYNTEMDGLTVTLTLKAPVNAGEPNTIKIGIADGGDGVYDSNLLIAGDSIQTALIAGDDEVTLDSGTTGTLDVLANDDSSASPQLTITAINGVSVEAGDTVMLPTGEKITLTDDGTLAIQTTGDEGEDVFSYTVTDGAGNTDIAFVTLTTTAPCFTSGALIATPRGEIPVETLRPGDPVFTRDHGTQVIRWVGQSARRACGADAPIRVASGAMGNEQTFEVSQQHRLLVTGEQATLYFAAHEVLAKAKDLLGRDGVSLREDGQPVLYVHLLFDRHEVLWADGVPSESYHPGQQTLNSFDTDSRAEVLRLFPGCDPATGTGFGPTARRVLRRHEAQLLLAGHAA